MTKLAKDEDYSCGNLLENLLMRPSRIKKMSITPGHRNKAQGAAAEGPKIEPMAEDFDWQDTAPLKLRPFKPTYFITMGKYSKE